MGSAPGTVGAARGLAPKTPPSMRHASYIAAALVASAMVLPDTGAARVPMPRTAIVHYASCPDGGGSCAYADRAEVYIEPGADLYTLMHELGHIFDRQHLNPWDRARFARLLGLPGEWNRGTGLDGLQSPHERFADAYATCALGLTPARGRWETAYDYNPSPRRHRTVCRSIRALG